MITSVEAMIEQYVSAWNENNLEGYAEEFSKCWAVDAVYTDPFSEKIIGVEGLCDFALKSLEIVPDRKFAVLEKPEHHHSYGRYAWQVNFSGQTNTGYDYFEFNADFEITRLVSFFKLPDDYPLDRLK